jgi:sulfite exporter TauE/SafE
LLFSLGRIASYAVAGALVGLVGHGLLSLISPHRAQTVGFVISGAFMIMLGLHLAGAWRGLSVLEEQGGRLWQRVAPVTRRLLRIERPYRALALGLLWGWLPCGLVYSMLAWAAVTGSPGRSAALMAVFGLGTLPMLMLMGSAAAWLDGVRRNVKWRRWAGALVLAFGLLTVSGLISPVPLHQTAHHSAFPAPHHPPAGDSSGG